MNAITPYDLKKWAKTNRKHAKAVMKATAFAACERERVDAYVRPIFAGYEFRADMSDGRPLTDDERLYLSKDEEGKASYYAALNVAHREHGFRGRDGYCPALIARDLQRDAENKLLESLAKFCGLDLEGINRNLDIRARMLRIALDCCIA